MCNIGINLIASIEHTHAKISALECHGHGVTLMVKLLVISVTIHLKTW